MNPGKVPTSRHGVASGILRLAIAAAILVYLSGRPRFPGGPSRRVDLAWVAAALVLGLLTQCWWRCGCASSRPPTRFRLTTFDVFEINLATRFYGLFLPGGGATAIAVRVVKLAG